MTMEMESALVEAARSGDMHAFEQLYRQTLPVIKSGARKLLQTEADDLVQATYLRALMSIDHFRGECRILTWLYTILRNQAAILHRNRLSHPWLPLTDSFEAPLPDPNAAMDAERALGILSEEERRLVSRTLEGYSDADICRELGMSSTQSTLRVQMWRARRKMRLALCNSPKQANSGSAHNSNNDNTAASHLNYC